MANAAVESQGFRGPQVCTMVGITYRQLDYWARIGFLVPSISRAHGSGSQRRYAYRDLVALKVIKRLLDAGLSLGTARRAIACLKEHTDDDLSTANLIIGSSTSVMVSTGDDLIDVLKGGQGVLSLVPMASVLEEVHDSITEVTQLHLFAADESDADAELPQAAHG